MKILIVGGGIAGPALGALLQKGGQEPLIIDQAPAWKHIGFGLSLWGTGRRVLKELGIEHRLTGNEYLVAWERIVTTKNKFVGELDFSFFGKHRPVIIHRADLHDGLVDLVKAGDVKLNTKIKEIKNFPDRAEATFTDDTTDTFDLVVAADGIHSALRKQILNENEVPYNWLSCVFWIEQSEGIAEGAVAIRKASNVLFVFPSRGGCFANLIVPRKRNPDQPGKLTTEEVAAYITQLGPEAKKLIPNIPTSDKLFCSDLVRVPLGRWYKDRVVFIGDSRHGVSPIGGMGANIALEDAYILAQELLKAGKTENIPAALAAFSERRTPRVKKLLKNLRFIEHIILVKTPIGLLMQHFIGLLPGQVFLRPLKSVVDSEP